MRFWSSPFLLLLLSLTIIACDQDDESNPQSGMATADGQSYTFNKAYRNSFGRTIYGAYDQSIYLTGEGVSFKGDTLNGKGTVIAMQLNTETSALGEGNYSLNSERQAGFTSSFLMSPEFDATYPDNVELLAAEQGFVNLSQDGDQYTIQYSVETDSGQVISGEFEGPIDNLNIEGELAAQEPTQFTMNGQKAQISSLGHGTQLGIRITDDSLGTVHVDIGRRGELPAGTYALGADSGLAELYFQPKGVGERFPAQSGTLELKVNTEFGTRGSFGFVAEDNNGETYNISSGNFEIIF